MKRHSLAPLLLLLLFAALPTLGASGDLDRSYGNGGFVFGSNADASTTLAIQPDDKVIAGGQCRVNGQSHFCLMRYLSNGAVDTSFGTGGQVYTPILTGASIARRLVVLPNGKILAVGYTSIPGNYPDEISYQFALARYNANGTLDPSFDGDGIVVNPIMTYRGAFAVDVAVQPDGKYVAAGGGTYPGKDFVAVRVNEDGSFDQSFGSAGIVTIATSYGSAQCVALQPDGKIVLGGWGGVSVHAVVARLTTAGVLDVSFNGSGILTYEVGYTSLRRMFVRPDGKILALGSGQPNIGSGNYLEIARINSNGTMDTTYDGDGIFFSTSSQGVPSRANDFLLQPDGKIVAAGNLSLNGNSYSASARYQADIPQLDNQFGDRGKILRLTTFDSTSVVMQSDGRLIFGGTRAVGPSAFQFFLVRHLNNGTRDADFDNDRKSDLSVFRPSTGTWYLSGSTNGDTAVQFGSAGDRLVPGDYDGDGRIDVAVFREGAWYQLRSSDGAFVATGFGQAGDVPVPADYDGDGQTDLAVFRGGVWYIINSHDYSFRAEQFGLVGDRPVIGNFDGDLRADLAVFRNGNWYISASTAGFYATQFGIAADRPVAADYDGDGKTDIAVYRDGTWYIQRSFAGFTAVQFGLPTDRLVPADYDGDGITDIGVFRDGTWYTVGSTAGFKVTDFGQSGDIAVPSAYVP